MRIENGRLTIVPFPPSFKERLGDGKPHVMAESRDYRIVGKMCSYTHSGFTLECVIEFSDADEMGGRRWTRVNDADRIIAGLFDLLFMNEV